MNDGALSGAERIARAAARCQRAIEGTADLAGNAVIDRPQRCHGGTRAGEKKGASDARGTVAGDPAGAGGTSRQHYERRARQPFRGDRGGPPGPAVAQDESGAARPLFIDDGVTRKVEQLRLARRRRYALRIGVSTGQKEG